MPGVGMQVKDADKKQKSLEILGKNEGEFCQFLGDESNMTSSVQHTQTPDLNLNVSGKKNKNQFSTASILNAYF
jgi:hypothetical protein